MRCWTHRRSDRKPTMSFRLALWTLTPDDLEPTSLKVIKLDVKYFKNGDRYDDGVNWNRIGNHPYTVDEHYDFWPWLTLNCPRSVQMSRIDTHPYNIFLIWLYCESIEAYGSHPATVAPLLQTSAWSIWPWTVSYTQQCHVSNMLSTCVWQNYTQSNVWHNLMHK